ncbi:hypothetical protein ACKGJO_14510 [Gracilimonas sp. Q87]|uniref:hypothetical protein n=1 Tax=Gracilimonas sp. Q87 TaxID=3384766 RepID=UPI00398442B0
MKIGIIGDAKRAVAWERHLRPHQIVHEVELCPSISELGNVDACFLVDESEQNLDLLLEGIHQRLNCFLVALQPTDTEKLETIYRASMEAGVHVQFSHWPTLAPATQWMMDRMPRPSYLSISRDIHYTQFMNAKNEFRHFWIDELGLCMKWMDSGIHHIEAKNVLLNDTHPSALHLFIRFDNGSTADINIYTGASSNRHKRISGSRHEILDCDAPEQVVRIGRLSTGKHLYFEKQSFDPSKAAEKAALMFLKSVQMKRETPFTPYDAYQLSLQIKQIEKRLSQYH